MLSTSQQETHVRIGGDFAKVFDHEDYIAMINAVDESSVVLRAHLILEEFLNVWSSRLTTVEDLFAGTYVPFKTKLCICRNLGLPAAYSDVLDKFNELRNRYSHRRKYVMDSHALESLRGKIDALEPEMKLQPSREFELFIEGFDQDNRRRQISIFWPDADAKKRLVIVFVVLVLKIVHRMQAEFNARGINYTLVVSPIREP